MLGLFFILKIRSFEFNKTSYWKVMWLTESLSFSNKNSCDCRVDYSICREKCGLFALLIFKTSVEKGNYTNFQNKGLT